MKITPFSASAAQLLTCLYCCQNPTKSWNSCCATITCLLPLPRVLTALSAKKGNWVHVCQNGAWELHTPEFDQMKFILIYQINTFCKSGVSACNSCERRSGGVAGRSLWAGEGIAAPTLSPPPPRPPRRARGGPGEWQGWVPKEESRGPAWGLSGWIGDPMSEEPDSGSDHRS